MIDGLFSGAFATCAVVLSANASDAAATWLDAQGELVKLKTDHVIDGSKDLYLIFVVETVEDASAGKLQRALDDVRVCRKICLERRGRSFTEVLDDVPFFRTPGTIMPVEEERPDLESDLAGLSAQVRRDLDMRSPEQMLARLINGDYDS